MRRCLTVASMSASSTDSAETSITNSSATWMSSISRVTSMSSSSPSSCSLFAAAKACAFCASAAWILASLRSRKVAPSNGSCVTTSGMSNCSSWTSSSSAIGWISWGVRCLRCWDGAFASAEPMYTKHARIMEPISPQATVSSRSLAVAMYTAVAARA